MLTIALLAALGNGEELALHLRATAATGTGAEDMREALLHVVIHAGVPRGNSAFRIAEAIPAERNGKGKAWNPPNITCATGHCAFRALKPGPYPLLNSANAGRPAPIHVSVFGPSFSQRLITQLYFEGDPRCAEVTKGFRGFARLIPDFETGIWSLRTLRPGAVAGRAGRLQAPHLNLWLVAEGINIGLNTPMYFPDEAGANATGPLLNSIESPDRRKTLVATAAGDGRYRFDIRLQGEGETVFIDI